MSGTPITRLYLARHGATPLTEQDRFSGATGTGLSEDGRRQAAKLGERLRHEGLTALYASPLERAVETAASIAGPCALPIRTEEGLREIHHGRWEGLTRDEVIARYPDEHAAWVSDPFTFAPAGGETGVSVLARSLPLVRDLAARHRGERILVVSHKATIRLLICALIGIDPARYRDRLDQAPACLNRIDLTEPFDARLVLFNDISHYAEPGR